LETSQVFNPLDGKEFDDANSGRYSCYSGWWWIVTPMWPEPLLVIQPRGSLLFTVAQEGGGWLLTIVVTFVSY